MLENKFISFILFFIITYSASFIGGMATISFKEPWYSELIKSNYNPPDWIFAPVWTILYLMMTLAIWFFWHSKNRDMNTIYIYFIHIVFNTTWSIVFFGLHQILFALIVVLVLIFLIMLKVTREENLRWLWAKHLKHSAIQEILTVCLQKYSSAPKKIPCLHK